MLVIYHSLPIIDYFMVQFERAQAVDSCADIVIGDIPLPLAGLSEGEVTPASRQRYLDIILKDLRAGGE
jgi:hypothetical protein